MNDTSCRLIIEKYVRQTWNSPGKNMPYASIELPLPITTETNDTGYSFAFAPLPVAHSASLDGAPLVRQRPPMRSWPDVVPRTRSKTLRCDRWRSEY